jgi:hypothetical protein
MPVRVVDRRGAELDRMHVLRSGHGHDAGASLDHVVVGGLPPARAMGSEGRERGVDQAWVDRRERLVAQPQCFERTGPIILYEDIGRGDEFLENVAICFGLQIERDGALVGGLRQKRGTHVTAVERLVGPIGAALIGLVGVLDLDHVSPQHGQLISRKRPRQNMRDVDHAYAFEGSRHRGLHCLSRSPKF